MTGDRARDDPRDPLAATVAASPRGHRGDRDALAATRLAASPDAPRSLTPGDAPDLASRSSLAVTLARSDAPPGLAPPEGPSPTAIGRYILLARLGQGGMGVVYAAYDPELDRKIALKIVHAHPGAAPSELGGLAWLMREAQAMARLSHPNIVQVYDVGSLADSLYIAMELIPGGTLGHWLRAPRPWRAIVDLFIAAGEGLRAAHEAGLIHRDFKPDNVLLGADARPRVTDFGLARAAAPHGDPAAPADPRSASPLDATMTHAGALLGTPAYMAPEQFTGGPTDARTDLFAFCVALYEALYGERPFAGDALADLQSAVLRGKLRDPPPGRRVPAWLRRILARGLAVAPERRHTGMAELLAELRRDPARAWRHRLLGVGLVAALAGGAWTWTTDGDRAAARCLAAAEDDLWDRDARAAVEGAFLRSGAPAAPAAWEAVRRLVDADTAAWSAARRDACRATHVHGQRSPHLLELQLHCLDRRRGELAALLDLFARADADVVERSLDALAALSPLARCADVDALLRQPDPPADPAAAAALRDLRGELDAIDALTRAGKYSEAEPRAAAAIDRATPLAYPPVLAEALRARARLEHARDRDQDATQTLLEAHVLARAARHDELARDVAIDLVDVLGRAGDLTGGQLWVRLAAAELARTPGDAARAALRGHAARIDWELGRYDLALAAYEDSLHLTERAFGPDHPATADAQLRLGDRLWARGQHDRARALLAAGRARLIDLLGPDHPRIADALRQEGNVYFVAGRYEEARDLYERALAAAERAYGPDHQAVSKNLGNLGAVHGALRQPDLALTYTEEALARDERRLGRDSIGLVISLDNLAAMLRERPDPASHERALQIARRSLAIRRQSLGDAHPELARSHLEIASCLRQAGHLEPALAEAEAALARREPVPDVHPILLARARALVAELLLDLARDLPRARRLSDLALDAFTAEGKYGEHDLAGHLERRRAHGLPP